MNTSVTDDVKSGMVSPSATDSYPTNFPFRTRFVAHPRACSIGGGSFVSSSDGSRAVIAGNDVLRLIRISDTSRQTSEHPNARLCVGPGGATIETSPNMWPSSGLKVDSAPTDVIWGRGAFDNKIVTSARNGEIVHWDISRLNKFESRVREHKRAINQLAASPSLPYMFVSGSQDGYLRLWDFRSPASSVLKVYHAAGIRTLALCPVPSHPMHVCVGLESGTIQRWDLRSKAQPLERVTLAHSCAVLSMDWQSPSMSESGLGWIVTSGMDRSVKIWDLTISNTNITTPSDKEKALLAMKMGGNGPIRTLHPSFIGRHVKWRQGSRTEIAIVSNIDSDSDSIVEIWDVRRGWIGKWALQHGTGGVEGSVTDIAFASENLLHILHTSGAFVQYDLHNSLIKPLDAVPRNSLAWTATGEMAFVTGLKDELEIPFDDVEDLNSRIDYTRYTPKSTTDPLYIPTDQTLGVLSIVKGGTQDISPEFNTLLGIDANRVTRLAKQYIFRSGDIHGGRKEICIANAKVASTEGDNEAARVWNLLATLLNDDDVGDESARIEVQQSHTTPPPQSSLLSLPESRSMSITLGNKNEDPQAETTGHTSASPLMARPTTTTIVVSSSPDNQSSTLTGHSQEKNGDKNSNQKDPQMSPVSMYDASISSAGMGDGGCSESIARRSPPVFPGRSRLDFRRDTVPLSSSSRRSGVFSRPQVGEGALDSSDDENDDAPKSEGSEGATHQPGTWNRSKLTSMMEEYRKLGGDGSIPLSINTSGKVPEEDHRGGASPGVMKRSTSAKSFSESSKGNLPTRPPYPRLSLSAVQDIDHQKLNSVNTKSGSASTSSSSSKIQMSKGRQTPPSASLSSSSSSLSKPVSQHVLKLPHIPQISPGVRVRPAKTLPTPSPLSRVFTPQSGGSERPITSLIHAQRLRAVSPDEHFPDEEEEEEEEEGASSESDSHSDLEEVVSDLDSDLEVEDGSDDSFQDPPSRLLARSNSVPVPSLISQTPSPTDPPSWNVPKRTPSKSSMRTVTVALPSRPASALSDNSENDVEGGDQVLASERITVMQESSASTRRPSPSPAASNLGTSTGTGLGLVNVTTDDNGGGNASLLNVSIHRLRPINLAVPCLEKKWRDVVWKEMKKNFEWLSENGNVQMCAMLAILVPKELKLRKAVVRRYIEAYVELLSRLRQHILAAHVRKYTETNLTEKTGQVAIYSACGRCNTSIRGAPRATLLCSKCKFQPNHCSICHLPVHRLFIHCPICDHGGHETCYRSYMASHPATELPISSTAFPLFSNTLSLFTQSTNSLYSGSSLGSSVAIEDSTSTYYSFSETASGGETSFEEEESELAASSNPTGSEHSTDAPRKTRLGTQNRPIQIWGHACPTGCGHWCWGSNVNMEGNEVLNRS